MGYYSIINGISAMTKVQAKRLTKPRANINAAKRKFVRQSCDAFHSQTPSAASLIKHLSLSAGNIAAQFRRYGHPSSFIKKFDRLKNASVKSFKQDIIRQLNPDYRETFFALAKMKNKDKKFVYTGKDLKEIIQQLTPNKEKLIRRLIPLTSKEFSPLAIENMKLLLGLSNKQVNKLQKHPNLLDSDILSIIEDIKLYPNETFNQIFAKQLKPATKFSQKVKVHTNTGLTVVSLPKKISGFPPQGYEVVAIIDQFSINGINIHGMRKHTHGELVQKVLTRGLEDKIGVLAYDIQNNNNIKEALNDILAKKRESHFNKYIKRLNLSMNKSMIDKDEFSYHDLSSIVGFKVNRDNIQQNNKRILDVLSRSKNDSIKGMYDEIVLINKLVDSGIDVYISAGNKGRDNIDFFTLSKAKIIGATDASGTITDYSSENPFVMAHARGSYGIFKGEREFLPKDPIVNMSQNGLNSVIELESKLSIKECLEEIESETTSDDMIPNILLKHNIFTSEPRIYYKDTDFYKLQIYREFGKNLSDKELKAHIRLAELAQPADEYVYVDNSKIAYLKLNGNILFMDRDGSGLLDQIQSLNGTSFATPAYIREEILGIPHIHATNRLTGSQILETYIEMMQKLRAAGVVNTNTNVENLTEHEFAKAGVSKDNFMQIWSDNIKYL